VYNLETTSGAYVAEGIVTHNCRCEVDYRDAATKAPLLLHEARCPRCRRKLGEQVNLGARLHCPRCKEVVQVA